MVDPQKSVLDSLCSFLWDSGYDVKYAATGEEAARLSYELGPCIIVMEVELADICGFELFKILQSDFRTNKIPVIFYTVRDNEMDLVIGFELGAYDYVSKKVSGRELAYRVIAVLRRTKPIVQKAQLSIGDIIIDLEQSIATRNGIKMNLSNTELQILRVLTLEKGRVLKRGEIVAKAWRGDNAVMKRTVDAYVKSLRTKLSDSRIEIVTIRGYGYTLRENNAGIVDDMAFSRSRP